ncbi:MAG: hypothetical protein ACTSVI_01565 [Promethearchaeota archaeon]
MTLKKKIFDVHGPPCKSCKTGHLDFNFFENFENTGTDWVQWYCTERCGYFINVEIL